MREFIIEEGSVHEAFLQSRAPFQLFGGGFGNGKTATTCVKAIRIVDEYPGCNGLIARATFPKLNDTIRKEFKRWCPSKVLTAFPTSKNSDNTAKFTNGSEINFRYISQQGKALEQSTSNQLSATYDFILVDQMEDPEITYKDFLDLIGRMRGNTIYRGHDGTMPRSGPQFFIMTCNPNAGWIYKYLVRPLQIYQKTGHINDDLLCVRDANGRPVLKEDGKPDILLEVFEAPTYANARNLSPQYLRTMESTYKGQMRDRYLLGLWSSYEGLVYPQWDDTKHVVPHNTMLNYLDELVQYRRYQPVWLEGYDFGIPVPSCYLIAFVDPEYKVHILDGFYKREYDVRDQAKKINELRAHYGLPDDLIWADPSVFRRTRASAATIGESTPDLFWRYGKIRLRRGNNDISNGIIKVSSYLTIQPNVRNPYNGDTFSPTLFVSDRLPFIGDEMSGYMWRKDPRGEAMDEPVDRNDHSLDTIKYMLSEQPDIGYILTDEDTTPKYMSWSINDNFNGRRDLRHG